MLWYAIESRQPPDVSAVWFGGVTTVRSQECQNNRKQRFGSEDNVNRKQRFGSESKSDQSSRFGPTNDQKQKGHLESQVKKSSQSNFSRFSSSNSSNSSQPLSKFNSVRTQKPKSSTDMKGKSKFSSDETTLIKRTYLVDISLTIPVPVKGSRGPKKLWVPKSA